MRIENLVGVMTITAKGNFFLVLGPDPKWAEIRDNDDFYVDMLLLSQEGKVHSCPLPRELDNERLLKVIDWESVDGL